MIRQTVLYKDQIVEDDYGEHERDKGDKERQTNTVVNKWGPSCNAHTNQYAQRINHEQRQELDRVGGQKRQREETDPTAHNCLCESEIKISYSSISKSFT